MANASLEDCQLFAQSEILQRDLFIAAKDQEDHPKKREDCVQHEAESVSASSLKINRFRNRWNSGEAHRGWSISFGTRSWHYSTSRNRHWKAFCAFWMTG